MRQEVLWDGTEKSILEIMDLISKDRSSSTFAVYRYPNEALVILY